MDILFSDEFYRGEFVRPTMNIVIPTDGFSRSGGIWGLMALGCPP
jgi:hypothetical protein